jgi:hypothetical protein
MKTLTTLIIYFLLISESYADNNWHTICRSHTEFAEKVMKFRQEGVSIAKMIELSQDEGNDIREYVESLILSAYEQPRFSTARIRQETIENFRDEAYLACAKRLKPKLPINSHQYLSAA